MTTPIVDVRTQSPAGRARARIPARWSGPCLRAGSSYKTSPHTRAKVLAGLGLAAGSTALLDRIAAASVSASAAKLTWTKLLLGVSLVGRGGGSGRVLRAPPPTAPIKDGGVLACGRCRAAPAARTNCRRRRRRACRDAQRGARRARSRATLARERRRAARARRAGRHTIAASPVAACRSRQRCCASTRSRRSAARTSRGSTPRRSSGATRTACSRRVFARTSPTERRRGRARSVRPPRCAALALVFAAAHGAAHRRFDRLQRNGGGPTSAR